MTVLTAEPKVAVDPHEGGLRLAVVTIRLLKQSKAEHFSKPFLERTSDISRIITTMSSDSVFNKRDGSDNYSDNPSQFQQKVAVLT